MAADHIYSMLLQSFTDKPERFNFVERDEERLLRLIDEQNLSNSMLTSRKTAINIGKIKNAEGMLFGVIQEDNKSLNVTLSLVDIETSKLLANAEVYSEDKEIDNLRWLSKGLALKIKQGFPLLQGNVTAISHKGFSIDFGSDMGAATGIKLLPFREIDLGVMIIKEPLDAIAKIIHVDKRSCTATIISGNEAIEETDIVITK